MAHHLILDFETRSTVELRDTGVYVYAADPTTDVWCCAYAIDDEEVKLWVPGDPVPTDVLASVENGWPIHAHNASFERILWRHVLTPRYGWPAPALEQWRCSMAQAQAMALPAGLENLVIALGLDIRKDMQGNALMKRMMRPRERRKGETTPADSNGLLWWGDEERKQRLYAYCKQDVEAERQAETRLLPLSEMEQRLYHLDQVINDRGVYIDEKLTVAALKIVKDYTVKLNRELKKLTGDAVYAGTNVAQLTEWLAGQGVTMETMDREAVAFQLTQEISKPARRALEIRQSVSQASVRKLSPMLKGRDNDGRARGLFLYHAASTGRWGSRRIQIHNLKRPSLKDVDGAIRLVGLADWEAVALVYGDPLAVVGDCLRGMVAAALGYSLLASDFSNIEGRALAWLAGEAWKLAAFRDFDNGKGPELYRLSYARAFGIPIDGVDDHQRQIGKVMELALGFEGGVGAFQSMAAAYGVKVSDEKAEELKKQWRAAHPMTKAFWRAMNDAAVECVANPGTRVEVNGKLAFMKRGSFMFMRLPSGRVLCYPYPRLIEMVWVEDKETGKRSTMTLAEANRNPNVTFDAEEAYRSVVYKGVLGKHQVDVYLYGGILTENAVQAVARDVLVEAMLRLESAGYSLVMHVHDEVVAEAPDATANFEEFNALMSVVPSWAEGFPIVAAGWKGQRYRK